MADPYVKELEEKVAHYEVVMSRCPQCKTNLPAAEVEPATVSSRRSRSTRSGQQSTAHDIPSTLTSHSERHAPVAKSSYSARSSKQLRSTSQTEVQARNVQQNASSLLPSAARSSSSRQSNAVRSTNPPHQVKTSSNHPNTASATGAREESPEQPPTSSRNLTTRPSVPPLSSSEGRQNHPGKLVDLDLQAYKKPRSHDQRGKTPGEAAEHDGWKRSAEIMLEEVPFGRNWHQAMLRIDSSVIAAVAIDNTPVSDREVSPSDDTKKKNLVQLVQKFAQQHSQGRINFQHFILACLCKVLSTLGIPKREIIETLQICISDTSEQNVSRYLTGAIWTNKLMDDLFSTGWKYRAVDLIAIWNRTIATYGRFGVVPESRQYFLTELTQREYFDGYQEVLNRRHDTIPWIVKKELGDEVTYKKICKALGYGDAFFEETRHLHSSIAPTPNINAGNDSDDAGSESQSRSFRTARQSTTSISSPRQSSLTNETPVNPPRDLPYLAEISLLDSQLLGYHDPDDAQGRVTPPTPSSAPQMTLPLIPQLHFKRLKDPNFGRQRRQPHDYTDPSGELLISTSMGESAPDPQSTKRPPSGSPPSASRSDNIRRRRRHEKEDSSREEEDSPS